MKRLFLAVKPNEVTLRNLVSLQEEVKSTCPIEPELCRWIAPPNLHLTLHFLGPQLPKRCLSTFGPRHECEQALDTLVGFPSRSHAGVLTIAAEKAVEPLQMLWTELKQALKEEGFPVEERPFVPHVTLARFKRRVKLPELPALPPLQLPVRGVWLYESVPTPEGSRYLPIASSGKSGVNEA